MWQRDFFYVSIRDETVGKIFRKNSFVRKDSLSMSEGISVFLPKIHN